MKLTRELLSNIRTIAVYGAVGSGKTALSYSLLNLFEDKRVYFFRHPKPHLIASLGYENITNLEQIENMENCVIYFDEIQLHVGIQDKKSNNIISKICSLARQKKITLIISTSDTRVFGKANEAFFDMWLVKQLDYDMIKNGSKLKQILKKNAVFDPSGISIAKNEFILDCHSYPELNGRDTFELLPYFTEEHSKPYKIATNIATKEAEKMTIELFSQKIPEKIVK